MPSTGLPQEVTVRPHLPSSSQIQWACYKVKSGMGSPDWNVLMVDLHLRNLLWVYCPGHAGVKGNYRADRLAGKATLTSGLLLRDLKCWEAWDTTCGHKAKNITPSIAWRREVLKEEALDDLPWKDERRPSSIRLWNCFKGNFQEISKWRGEAHMGFSECRDTILNWTELYTFRYAGSLWQ